MKRGRKAGGVNARTAARLEILKRMFALGKNQAEALDGVRDPKTGKHLTPKERRGLIAAYARQATPETNGQFYGRFHSRWQRNYMELARIIQISKGVKHPDSGKPILDAEGNETGQHYPEWEIKPNMLTTIRAVSEMRKMDTALLNTSIRLGIQAEKPRQVEIQVKPYEERSEGELDRDLNDRIAELGSLLSREELEATGILEVEVVDVASPSSPLSKLSN